MIVLLLSGLAAVHAPATAAPRCPPAPVTMARHEVRAPGFRRLGDLPPANQYLAVDRQFGGCREPAVVRTGIGR
jgi:hypothetical protein